MPLRWHGIVGSLGVIGLVAAPGLIVDRWVAGGTKGPVARAPAPRRLAVVDSLSGSEALSYDPVHDVYLVSNVNGTPQVKDGNGFISRIGSDGKMDSLHFIQGGRNGVVLNGPMGSRILGDTLWVVDIDAVRAFDTGSGRPITSIDLTPVHPVFTNDLAFDPNGDIYITDTGVHSNSGGTSEHRGPDRIYRVTRDGKVTIALETPALDDPDGIAWNSRGKNFLLAPIGGQAIQTWKPGQRAPVNLPPGAGKFDGIEVESDGRAFITSWADSSVFQLHGTQLHRSIGPLDAPPADFSLDQRSGHVGLVFLTANRFELWELGS
jgi:SMP-30/gluconolaconase/LRE-like protein